MRFRIEFSAAAERDFELVFDHLVDSYRGFGESREDAMDHAMRRVLEIRRAPDSQGPRLAGPQTGWARHQCAARHATISWPDSAI